MTKYFLICASRDHVMKGVEGGFAQAGHGRKDYMSQPSKGDWVVFYSAKKVFGGKELCQKFTAIGQVSDDEPYQPDENSHFKPYRRNVTFKKATETDIHPLLDKLEFVKNKKSWGFYLVSGFRELLEKDFTVIQKAML